MTYLLHNRDLGLQCGEHSSREYEKSAVFLSALEACLMKSTSKDERVKELRNKEEREKERRRRRKVGNHGKG